jgi:hypothetical protein
MSDPPPAAASPDKSDGDRGAMIPQEMAIQLLQSKNERIAAAAARVFSPRGRSGSSPILAAAMAAVASQPPPTAELPPAASAESMGGDSVRSATREASASASAAAASLSFPTEVGTHQDTADTNDDSSTTAASALKAMASADHESRSAAPTAAAAATSVPRMPGKKFSSTERLQRR